MAIRREELAALLWGDKDEAHARQSLRQALLRLKKEAGDVLDVDSETVALRNGGLELDLQAFDEDVKAGRFADAVARYDGDFLSNQEAAGGETFRSWVDGERERARRLVSAAFKGLLSDVEARGDLSEASMVAERWTRIAPLNEAAYHCRLTLLQRQGRISEALALFEEFRHQLASALETEPTDAFLSLRSDLENALRRENTTGAATLRMPVLAGRRAELATVRAIWARIADESAVVLIESDEGGGRSRFLRETVDVIRRSQGSPFVLQAGSYGGDDLESFSMVRRLLSGLEDAPGISGSSQQTLAEVAVVVPALRNVFRALPAAVGTEASLTDAVHRVLSDLTFEVPLVLALDDFVRGDDASIRLLTSLISSPPPSTLILLTARSDELVRSAHHERGVARSLQRLKLQALGSEEVNGVLSSMLDVNGERDALGRAIHAESGGNPFYVVALIHALVDDGALAVDATGKWRATTDVAQSLRHCPTLVRNAIGDRLADLTMDGRRVADVAAVMGGGIRPALLQQVVGLPAATFTRALDELLVRRVLSRRKAPDDRYEFTHPIVGRAICELIAPLRRQEIEAILSERANAPSGSIDSVSISPSAEAIRVPSTTKRQRFILAATTVALLGGIGAAFSMASRGDAAVPDAVDQRLVVLPFQNETGRSELQTLGHIAADWLTQGISKTALVTVVPQLGNASNYEQPRSPSNGVDAARAAINVGADIVVWGTYELNGDSLAFHARVTDARTARLLETLDRVVSAAGQPMVAVEKLRQQTLAAIAPWVDERLASAAGVQSQPPSFAAYKLFAEGLDFLYRRDGAGALPLFMRAYAIDTMWTLPLLHAAGVHIGHMNLSMADSLVRILQSRQSDLPPYDRHVLDAMAARLKGDAPSRFAAARALAQIAPNSFTAVMDLPSSAIALNLMTEALDILASIDTVRGAARDLPGFWNMYATVLHANGFYERQLEMGRAIQRRLPQEFRALFWQARALAALGRLEELDPILEQGLRLPPNPEWGPHGMRMHVVISDELVSHGHPEKAREILERSLRFYSAAPEEIRAIRKHRFDVATALHRLGRQAEARRILEELLRGPDVLGANPMVLRGILGVVAASQGDVKTALEIDHWLEQSQTPYLFGTNTEFRARIHATLGNKEEAVRLLQQAIAEGRQYEGNEHHIFEFQGLRGFAPFEEWLRSKG